MQTWERHCRWRAEDTVLYQRCIEVEIRLTQEDIDIGCRKEPINCPWYRAIRRVCKPDVHVSVQTQVLYLAKLDDRTKLSDTEYWMVRSELPQKVSQFIQVFDKTHPSRRNTKRYKAAVHPMTIRMALPIRYVRPEYYGNPIGGPSYSGRA